MSRLLGVALVLCWASATFGQIIFAPPVQPRPVAHTPPTVEELQNALRQPRLVIVAPVPPPTGYVEPFLQPGSSILIVPSTPVVSPEAAGLDSQTGQPLYFRKHDLIQPPGLLTPQAPQTQPLIVPQLERPGIQPLPEPGKIIIKPWQGGAKSFASR